MISTLFDWLNSPVLGLGSVMIAPLFRTKWREALIVILIIIIGFGGWYYSAKISNLTSKVETSSYELAISKSNELTLKSSLEQLNVELTTLEDKTLKLKTSVTAAENEIALLESNLSITSFDLFALLIL